MAEPASAHEWAVALFGRSVLKQRKLAEVAGMLGPTAGLARALEGGAGALGLTPALGSPVILRLERRG